ncbi:hypothetical protein [Desulforamulus reducens]|uniref:hypothetical protein n=1 Tax=Desulforamulus reducens TaxID=59610 RepID=UPI0002FD9114|nr:hypothetical protein [Desulforamulus reducens]
MKKVIIPLLGTLYLGLSAIGNKLYCLLYEEDKNYGVPIEMCRPWERRQRNLPYQNTSR